MAEYLVWSNQKGMWWRAAERGYTPIIEEAGRYTREQATEIVRQATLNGKLGYDTVDPVTNEVYLCLDEVMVLAPESIGGEA